MNGLESVVPGKMTAALCEGLLRQAFIYIGFSAMTGTVRS